MHRSHSESNGTRLKLMFLIRAVNSYDLVEESVAYRQIYTREREFAEDYNKASVRWRRCTTALALYTDHKIASKWARERESDKERVRGGGRKRAREYNGLIQHPGGSARSVREVRGEQRRYTDVC